MVAEGFVPPIGWLDCLGSALFSGAFLLHDSLCCLALDRSHRRRNRCGLRRFSPVHSSDAPHQAAHWQLSFGISEENFARAGSAIAPALEDREVLHTLDGAGGFGGGKFS